MVEVVAVVPAYEPDVDSLQSLVTSLTSAGVPTLVVDDGSEDAAYLERFIEHGVASRRHDANCGIARSLNDGVVFAHEQRASWLLTVDQDTTLPTDYVARLLAEAPARAGVIGAETISDVAGDLRYPARLADGILVTEEVFQTGSAWSVVALDMIGGFDESFGIDAVDADACLRLREAGFLVTLARGVRLEHQYGEGRAVQILGRTVWATGHSPQRRESMVRNRLRLLPRELRQSPAHALRTMRRIGMNVLLAATVEDDRWAKAKGAARGLRPRPRG